MVGAVPLWAAVRWYSVVVSISGCDPLDPGSNPGTASVVVVLLLVSCFFQLQYLLFHNVQPCRQCVQNEDRSALQQHKLVPSDNSASVEHPLCLVSFILAVLVGKSVVVHLHAMSICRRSSSFERIRTQNSVNCLGSCACMYVTTWVCTSGSIV